MQQKCFGFLIPLLLRAFSDGCQCTDLPVVEVIADEVSLPRTLVWSVRAKQLPAAATDQDAWPREEWPHRRKYWTFF